MEELPIETRKPVADCLIDTVTVYVDRAEVTRSISFDASAGTHSLIISGIAEAANTDSIRVKGVAGTAPCTILEVSFDVHTLPVTSSADTPGREATARAARATAEERAAAIKAELARVQQEDSLVSKYVTSMLGVSGQAVAPAAGADIATVRSLLEFQAEKGEAIDSRLAALRKDLASAEQELEVANEELKSLAQATHAKTVRSRDVTIILAVPAPGVLRLSLTYLVAKASWAPSYDARVERHESGGGAIQLTYFGVVKQSTGEDWSSVALSLSTASPATGGNPPLPPTRVAQWRRPQILHRRRFEGHASNMAISMQSAMPTPARMTRQSSLRAEELSGTDCDREEDAFASAVEGASVATAAVEGGAGSATFAIERRSTIASDNKEHKVTVTILHLTPTLRHFATPALEECAYLQARAANASGFPLLESQRVAVFFDGSFVTTTAIKHTSPGESLLFFLGVDASVKIDHRLIKKTANTGEKAGLFSAKEKTTSRLLYEYRTLVNNTHKYDIELTIVELFPRSADDKITVELKQPESIVTSGDAADAAAEGALKPGSEMRNKITNNVVFSRTLKPQAKLEVPFSYVVTWPHDAGTGEVEVV